MQITLHAPELKAAVRAFARIVPSNPSLPVLGNIHVRGASGIATLTATNLDEALSLRTEGACAGDGEFLLPFDELKRTASAMAREDFVTIEPASERTLTLSLSLKGTGVNRTAATTPATEFPAVECLQTAGTPVSPGLFLSAFKGVARVACTDPTRAAIAGILVDGADGRLVATDGRRLSTRRLPGLHFDGAAIVPRTRLLLNGVLDSHKEGSVGIVASGGFTRFILEAGPWQYQIRCPDLHYPNWRQVVPDDTHGVRARFTVRAEDVAQAGRLLEQVAGGQDSAVCLYVGGGRLCAFAGTHGTDSLPALVDLPFAAAEAEPGLVLTVNSRFLLDALETGFTEVAVVDDGVVPLVMRSPDFEGVHALMPMQSAGSAELAALIEGHLHPGKAAVVQVQSQESADPDTPAVRASAPAASAQAAVPESPVEGAGSENTDATAPSADDVLTFVPQSDPVDELLTAVSQAQEQLQAFASSLRTLRAKARALARERRRYEKALETRTREVEARAAAIARFQKAVNF